jgi:hypothetical protein
MRGRRLLITSVGLLVCSALTGSACARDTAAVRQSLDQAKAAATAIELGGDQSAARRAIACVLAYTDPSAALEAAAGIRRPSDAARAIGAAASVLAESDPDGARQAATTAGRLLLRIADPRRRAEEQRLLLTDAAALGEGVLAVAPELREVEARVTVLVARARTNPEHAAALLREWKLVGRSSDEALMAIAPRLSPSQPEEALELAGQITSAELREATLWLIAEQRPPAEAIQIAQNVGDPVTRSAILTSAALRIAGTETELALATARSLPVAPESALAELAASLAPLQQERALELARSLPEGARVWSLGRIAVGLAGREPDRAEELLEEVGGEFEIVRLAAARMAEIDPARAARLVQRMLEGDQQDRALADVVGVLAARDAAQASDLLWQIRSPEARAAAAAPVARALAATDTDAATAVIGLVPDRERAQRLRCEVAAVVAGRDADAAARLLSSLPPSDYRAEAALDAARAVLLAGRPTEEALPLATIALERDLALRWLVPRLVESEMISPLNLAGKIESPYLQALSLVDLARVEAAQESKCRPLPARGRQIRIIVEWEGA